MPHILREAGRLLTLTVQKYVDDGIERMGAALAFYAVFSLIPVLVIALSIASFVLGREAASGHLHEELRLLIGPTGADLVNSAMLQATAPGAGAAGAFYGAVVLLLGASGAFLELHAAMNRIWGVEHKPAATWLDFLERRLLSFVMVLVLGGALAGSTLLSTVVQAADQALGEVIDLGGSTTHLLNLGATFAATTPLVAGLYKWLPDTHVAWKDVAVGAPLTMLVTGLGQIAIGLYLGNSPIVSAYGAAGSLVIVLMWVYLTAQLLLLGAAFTQVWATRRQRAPRVSDA